MPVNPQGEIGQIADVEQIDDEQVARLGSFDAERTAQVMHFRQINVANIIGAVAVEDLAPGPIETFDAEFSRRA